MAKFRKKPVVIEAITFEEFVAFAKETTQEPHWHIPYQGVNITQENEERYIIPTLEGNHNFTPEDMLITGVQGEIYPCKKDIFEATYEAFEEVTFGLTFQAAETLLKRGNCIALPEWGGFWFIEIKTGKTLVLTKEGIIVDTPWEEFKKCNDWKVVVPNPEQEKILYDYFNPIKKLSFGQAIEALKQGKKVARTGWNGLGMFLYLVPGSVFKVNREPLLSLYEEGVELTYRPHIDLKTADGSIATWSPSGSDALAEDWIILE